MGNELHKSFDEILKHYYSEITLATVPAVLSANQGQNKVIQSFWTKDGKAYLVVDNKYNMDYIDASINNVDEKITLDTSQRYNRIDLSEYLQKGMNTVIFSYPAIHGKNKGIRLYIELAGDDDSNS